MISATRPCVALLLAVCAGLACAADSSTSQHVPFGLHQDAAGPARLAVSGDSLEDGRQANKDHAPMHLQGAGDGIPDLHDLKSGLQRKLDGGWLLGLRYGHASAVPSARERDGSSAPRADASPAFQNAGPRALVFSMARSF
jgi:hypothetical protein